MNDAFGYDYGESKYRKEYAYFNAGRIYERRLDEKGVHTKILAISDLHVPFHLPVETFSEYAGRIDALVINGDLIDFSAISKFSKCYRNSPMDEIIECRQYLIDLIEYLSPKDVYITFGNHDVRLQAYLSKNLDTDLLELMPETPIDLIVDDGIRRYDKRSKSKVWYEPIRKVFPDVEFHYEGDWRIKIGSVWFAHPLTFSSGNLKTAEKALDYFLKNDLGRVTAIVLGHTHKSGDIRKGLIQVYEQGACCQTEKMTYTDGRLTDKQQKGFMFVALDENGDLMYDATKRIIL